MPSNTPFKQLLDIKLADTDLEASILGLMIDDNTSTNSYLSELSAEDFYSPINKKIFEAIQDLHSKDEAINFISVPRFVKISQDDKQELFLNKYISDIVTNRTFKSYLPQNVKILKEYTTRRILKAIAYDLDNNSSNLQLDINEIGNNIQDSFTKLFTRDFKKSSQNVSILKEKVKDRFILNYENLKLGIFSKNDEKIKTRMFSFDAFLDGGFTKSGLVTLGGRPGAGKSTFALNLAYSMSKKLPVLFLSLEMKEKELTLKLVSSECDMPSNILATGAASEIQKAKILESMDKLNDSNLFIDDSENLLLIDIENKIRDFIQQYGIFNIDTGKKEIASVFIDHIGFIQVPNKQLKREQIDTITKYLKGLAKKFDIVIIEVSPVGRDCEKRDNKRPQLSDLSDSQSLDYDSDLVIFLYRDLYYDANTSYPDILEVIIAKNRHGRVGTVKMYINLAKSQVRCLEGQRP